MMSESVANATVPVKKRWGALKQAVVEPTTTTPGSSADAMQSNGGFKKKGVSALRERMRAFEEKANMQETSEKMPEPPPPPRPTPVVNTKAVESAPLVRACICAHLSIRLEVRGALLPAWVGVDSCMNA